MQVTRDRALKEWVMQEKNVEINREFGSGYPGGNALVFVLRQTMLCFLFFEKVVMYVFI